MGKRMYDMGSEMHECGEKFTQASIKSVERPSYKSLLALLETQDYLCAISGVRLDLQTAELDHKIPVARGGTNALRNLQWIHKDVNRCKGTLTNEEFIEVCLRIARRNR
jgi:hypothetical protein